MAGALTKTPNFEQTVTALVRSEIMENLRPNARWLVPGAYIPGRLRAGTNKIRHIAYGDLAVQTSLITEEGTPPNSQELSIGYDEYAVQQRGRLVAVSDVAMALSPHELMSVAAEKVAFDALMTVDRSIAAAFTAGTGIALTPLAGTKLEGADIRRWVADMKFAYVDPFPDGYYIAMVHPDVIADLQSDGTLGGWIEASKYADPSRLLTGEIGRMYGVRFVETVIGTRNALATDTFNTFLLSPDCFAFGDLQSVETYMVRPGGDHADPLAQKGLVGYKGMWGAKTLNIAEGGGPRFGKITHAGLINRP
jgi:N4-gp56 family major capsid protein